MDLIDGCYTAKADEDYLLIGNFGSEAFSSCANVDTLGFSIFVDDVSLIAEKKLAIDTTLCQDEVWKINAADWRAEYKTLQGWTYRWDNEDTSPVRTLTQAGNHKLTVSRNGCFLDVYDVAIKYTNECNCEINVPTAFTPNGDQLNDLFLPHILRKTVKMTDYRLSVFNMFGQKVFYTTDTKAG